MLDTKLKSSHSLGLAAAVLVIITATVLMFESFPYFEEQAGRQEIMEQESRQLQKGFFSNINAVYLAALEKESGKMLDPVSVFLPAIDNRKDETNTDLLNAVEEAKSAVYSLSDRWDSNLNSVEPYIHYQVLNAQGKILNGNIEGDLASKLRLNGSSGFMAYTVVEYDSEGVPVISGFNGIDEQLVKDLIYNEENALLSYSYSLFEEYLYSPEFNFVGPRDCTVIFALTPEGVQQYHQNDIWLAYRLDGSLIDWYFLFTFALFLCALLLPLIPVFRVRDIKLFRAPFELVGVIFCVLLSMGDSFIDMVVSYNDGSMAESLMSDSIFRTADNASAFATVISILYILLVFAGVYWSGACLRAVFQMGIRRYCRERTLVSMIFRGIGRFFQKMFGYLDKVDLSKKETRIIFAVVGINFLILALFCSMWFFGIGALLVYSVGLYIVLQIYYSKLQHKYQLLQNKVNQMAKGELEGEITEDLAIFEPMKEQLLKIQDGFRAAVVEEVKSEKMKSELITNVSHDLKTPLTAIITYVNLLKEETAANEKQREYIEVLDKKSMRLKALIEDLFEISKASSGNVNMNLEEADVVSLLKEVRIDLEEKLADSGILFRWQLPDEKVMLLLDCAKTYRVFENLLVNISKYALAGSRAYIEVRTDYEKAVIQMKNISAEELNVTPEELTERFVRGDRSRNTEGSGLGLAIARSFVELQGGKMTLETEADLFKVTIEFDRYKPYADHNS